ncbi:hypothetical protein GGD61_005793 [Bradyrhizobium sp. SBR1B]|nr:hypothetical protein [Bradyrhizobium sp. SBR1B]
MIGDLQHRQSRQRHVAEAVKAAHAIYRLDRRSEYRGVAGQQGCELSALIRAIAKSRKIGAHLLEAEHVRIERLPRDGNDPGEISDSVAPLATLYVPGQKPHHRIPARMND